MAYHKGYIDGINYGTNKYGLSYIDAVKLVIKYENIAKNKKRNKTS
jgi:hypothetical protein